MVPSILTHAFQSHRNPLIHRAIVRETPALIMISISFSLHTLSYALLKSSNARTVRLAGRAWKPSLIDWDNRRFWSSQDLMARNPACSLHDQPFDSARKERRVAIIFSNVFAMQEVSDIGRKESIELAGFPFFRIGTITASLQDDGQYDGAPFAFMLVIAFVSSALVKDVELSSSTVGVLRERRTEFLMRQALGMFRELISAYILRKASAFPLFVEYSLPSWIRVSFLMLPGDLPLSDFIVAYIL